MENSVEFPLKTRSRTTILSSNPTHSHISEKKNENTSSKRYMHPNVRTSIIHNYQDMEATQCPSIDKWVRKCGILLSHKERMKFCHLQQHGWTQRVLCQVKYECNKIEADPHRQNKLVATSRERELGGVRQGQETKEIQTSM